MLEVVKPVDGDRIISRIDGKNASMLMDITVREMEENEIYEIYSSDKETAILLFSGEIVLKYEDQTVLANRKNVFEESPFCLHVCRGVKIVIIAFKASEIIVQQTENSTEFNSKMYKPKDCKREVAGVGVWNDTAKREILTIFDYNNAPYSNMVMGEVITLAGRWSSYIPHSHPQPEVYYYKFDRPTGFGACFLSDDVHKITNNSYSAIEGGLTHPQTSAPGYNMYYCWMIRHLDNNPWTSRDNDPAHTWML